MQKTITPYNDLNVGKKEQVAKMFNSIAGHYDFLNHFLSMGIDKLWRGKAIKLLSENNPKMILDVATGTGDFAIEAMKLNPEKIFGVDISEEMLAIGKKKIAEKKLDKIIFLQKGDSENLDFADNTFDAITVGFGVRNFENLEKGLKEMKRVLKPNAKIAILEFSKPKIFPMKQLFGFYFNFVLPLVGKIISKDKSAYSYLPESVKVFPEGNDFVKVMEKVGFHSVKCIPLTFGICSIYIAKKSADN